MARVPRQPKPPRIAAARYGIAEWYGKDIAALTPEERQAFGQLAVKQSETARSEPSGCASMPVSRNIASWRTLQQEGRRVFDPEICAWS